MTEIKLFEDGKIGTCRTDRNTPNGTIGYDGYPTWEHKIYPNREACANVCLTDEMCKGYSWNKSNNDCQLYGTFTANVSGTNDVDNLVKANGDTSWMCYIRNDVPVPPSQITPPSDIVKLFIKCCPIIYFYKDEPYMPCNFDDLLKIANVTKKDLKNLKLITIPKEKRFDHPIGTQILCRTEGFITASNRTYIDLVYIITWTWNGTIEEHAFDKEEIIIRLEKNTNNEYEIIKVFTSRHGKGLWLNMNEIDIENNRIVLYSANESHAIYNEPRVYKRIFGFGNDVCGHDIKWEPTEFVIFMTESIDNNNSSSVNIYDSNFNIIKSNVIYFKYINNIGDTKDSQQWPGQFKYATLDIHSYNKYEGGIDNVFSGKYKKINITYRYLLRTISVIVLILFLMFLIYNNVIKSSITGKFKNIGLILLQIFIYLLLFLASAYISWELFILNPINNNNIDGNRLPLIIRL